MHLFTHTIDGKQDWSRLFCDIGAFAPLVKEVLRRHDLPDAPNCVVIKDSFGNCLAPFFTQNYHTVYVVDYRYYSKSMSTLISSFEIDDVIFVPNLGATQSSGVNDLLQKYKK